MPKNKYLSTNFSSSDYKYLVKPHREDYIQDALDADGIVRLEQGNYTATKNTNNTRNSCIVMDDNQKLRGAGTDATNITLADSQDVIIITSVSYEDNDSDVDDRIEISNITIDGNKSNNTGVHAVALRTSNGIYKHLCINNASDVGFAIIGQSGIQANLNRCFDLDIRLSGNTNMLIQSCADNMIDNCHLWKPTSHSYYNLNIVGSGNRITNTKVESDLIDGGIGVRVTGWENEFENCKVGGNTYGGYWITSSNASDHVGKTNITAGMINQNGVFGVKIDGSDDNSADYYVVWMTLISGVKIWGHVAGASGRIGVWEVNGGRFEDYTIIDNCTFWYNQTDYEIHGSHSKVFGGSPFHQKAGVGETRILKRVFNHNEVTNGTFDSDQYWLKSIGWSISGGTASKAAGTAANLKQAIPNIEPGRSYSLVFTVSSRTAGSVTVYVGKTAGTARSTNATFTETITAQSTSFSSVTGGDYYPELIFTADADFDGSIDNVSLVAVSGPLFEVQAGDCVENVWVKVGTTWNDGGAKTLDIGDGSDDDGFLANANIDLTSQGYYGYEYDEGGAYLWDAGNSHRRNKVYTSADTIDMTLDIDDDGTQGNFTIFAKVTNLG